MNVCNLVDRVPACFAGAMGTEPTEAVAAAAVDAALQPMRDTLQVDGYALEWSLEEPDQIGVRVFATSDSCEDCLVPPDIMRAIITKALLETPYTVGTISLPPKS